MALKQISVFVANETGSLGKLVNVLAEAGVDMRAMSIADTQATNTTSRSILLPIRKSLTHSLFKTISQTLSSHVVRYSLKRHITSLYCV